MTPQEVIAAIEQYATPEIESLVASLAPVLPIAALIKLAENIALEITARNEVDAMRASVQAVDAEVDAAEKAALEALKK
jgi:hypothetical protein